MGRALTVGAAVIEKHTFLKSYLFLGLSPADDTLRVSSLHRGIGGPMNVILYARANDMSLVLRDERVIARRIEKVQEAGSVRQDSSPCMEDGTSMKEVPLIRHMGNEGTQAMVHTDGQNVMLMKARDHVGRAFVVSWHHPLIR
jgi:hypothetical protein